jgi:three-Cys-motif partner protein
MSRRSRLALASDGQLAREVNVWNSEKLHYVGGYMDIFCSGMKKRWRRLVYADLLAGPGRCIDVRSRAECLGSPLLALSHPEFCRLFFNDADARATTALAARAAEVARPGVRVETGDCNDAVTSARELLFPSDERSGTLGLAVIDPSAFDMRFDAIARLADWVHLDLIIIFMSGFIRRFARMPGFPERLDEFFGTSGWRAILKETSQGKKLTYRRLLDLYEEQLRAIGYTQIPPEDRIVNRQGGTIYHIIFASKHPRGADFFKKISARRDDGQRSLF